MPLPTNIPQQPKPRTSLKRAARSPRIEPDTELEDQRFDEEPADNDDAPATQGRPDDDMGRDVEDPEPLDFSEDGDEYVEETTGDSGMGERIDDMYANATGTDGSMSAREQQRASGPAQDASYPQGTQAEYRDTVERRDARLPDVPVSGGYPYPPAMNTDNGGSGYSAPGRGPSDQASQPGPVKDRDIEEDGGGKGRGRRKKGKYDRKRKSNLKNNDVALSESHARTWRWVILVSLLIIICIGFKNAIFPPPSLSRDDVRQEVYLTTGTTRFPLDRGAAVATGFVAAYIPISNDPAATSMLENYYSGTRFKTESSGGSVSQISPAAGSQISQVIQEGPYVYKQKAVSDTTANYVVGALVYRRQDGQPIMTKDGKSPEYRWLYLNVGIYWDEKTDRLAIDPNSPTVTEPPDMKASTSLPPAQLPGDGKLNQDVTDQASDTITNFMKSWSKGDRSALKTLTSTDRTPATLNGLDGKLVIRDTSSMKMSVYGPPATDRMYRALVEVKWSDVVSQTDGQTNSVDYNSKYIIKLEKTPEGKFLVQDINPYYYIPGK